MISTFASRLALLESGKLSTASFNETLFVSVAEELRLFICMTSEYQFSEIEREIHAYEVTDKLSFAEEIRLRLINAREALQFHRLELAQAEYLRILRSYENLSAVDKQRLYLDVHRLYFEVSYVKEIGE